MSDSGPADPGLGLRLLRLAASITVLTAATVVGGYGGWLAPTLTGYDPETVDGEPLGDRLVRWPERNRAVLRSNGRASLPLRP